MKIIGLEADGYRKLLAVEMQFTSKGLIPIYGKNKMGKTSLPDFIRWMILGNKELNPDIINWEKDRIKGKLVLGNYEIERVLPKKGTPKLKVKNTITNEYEKGEVQNFLSTFINELTMNPRPFLDLNTLGKLKFLMELLGIDFTDINKQMETLEQDRLLCGREIKKFGDLDDDKPENIKRVNTDKLFSERKKMEARNRENSEEYSMAKQAEIEEIEAFNKVQRLGKDTIRNYEAGIKAQKEQISNWQKEIKALQLKIAEQEVLLKERKTKLAELPIPEEEKPLKTSLPDWEPEPTEKIDKQIQEANAINVKADAYEKWQEKKKEKAEKEKEYDGYDGKIKNLREDKLDILKKTNTGVGGLEIREDGLYYKDAHSQNWSDAEALRIASELCLAQIDRDKQIEAIFLDRFESFDDEMREDFDKWCVEKDIQAIVTIVKTKKEQITDEGNYFYIEDGSVEFVEGENND